MPWPLTVVAAAAAVVAIVALIGGFNDVPVERLPLVELGETHEGSEILTTVTSVYLTTVNPATGTPAEAGEQFLAVNATLENTSTRPNLWQRDTIRVVVDGAIEPEEQSDSNVEVPGNRGISFLQAGLPTDLVYLWRIKTTDATPGDDVIVGIFDRFRVTNDPVFDDTAYTSPTPVARIVTTIGAQP